jgi:hypothetical protein
VARLSVRSIPGICSGLVLLSSACAGVTPTITTLTPNARGSIWARLEDHQSIACLPGSTPAPPDVTVWWVGHDPATQTAKVVTGYQIWSNTSAGCNFLQEDDYRGLFSFPLAALQALSTPSSPVASRINQATLKFTVNGSSADVSNGGQTCQSPIGGLGGITVLRPGVTFTAGLNRLVDPANPPNFASPLNTVGPSAVQLESFATEFKGRIPSPGTRGRATFTPSGADTVVEVDVRDFLQGALNRGDASIGFMLLSFRESLPSAPPAVQLDCRMLVSPDALTVKSF